MMELGVIILAAGVGKRMKSKIPKVLHPICGRPMLSYVIDTAVGLKPSKIVVVISPKMKIEPIRRLKFVIQDPPRGTGDAVICAEPEFKDFNGSILVLCGDVPLLTLDTLNKLVKFHKDSGGAATVLTAIPHDSGSYGRVVRAKSKSHSHTCFGAKIKKIVEDSDASPQIKKISEVNSGIYVFDKNALFDAIHKIKPSNVQQEYYLTDTIEILAKAGKVVYGFRVEDWREVIGINTRKTLVEVESILQARIIERHLLNGVTIMKPETVVIDFDVKISMDTIIYPGVKLLGKTEIGEDCEIGANTIIVDSFISSGTTLGEGSTIINARL